MSCQKSFTGAKLQNSICGVWLMQFDFYFEKKLIGVKIKKGFVALIYKAARGNLYVYFAL